VTSLSKNRGSGKKKSTPLLQDKDAGEEERKQPFGFMAAPIQIQGMRFPDPEKPAMREKGRRRPSRTRSTLEDKDLPTGKGPRCAVEKGMENLDKGRENQ